MFVQQLGSLILVTKLLINLVSADQLFSIDILSDAFSIPSADISNSISRFINLELSQRRQSRLSSFIIARTRGMVQVEELIFAHRSSSKPEKKGPVLTGKKDTRHYERTTDNYAPCP